MLTINAINNQSYNACDNQVLNQSYNATNNQLQSLFIPLFICSSSGTIAPWPRPRQVHQGIPRCAF